MVIQRTLLLFVSTVYVATEKCITPNNEEAECISLDMCPILVEALATNRSASIEFVRNSTCGFNGSDALVCCGSSHNFTTISDLISKIQVAQMARLLPNRKYCGLQHTDDYFRVENVTAINEFPWSAILLYGQTGNISAKCSGSLISNRFVLTAAHCVSNSTGYANFAAVRLGEYNINNETDCTEEQFYECSEPPQDFGIEKVMQHPGFNPQLRVHNIALVRLNKAVTYSDYVRPICLPIPGTPVAKVGDILTTVGWGRNQFDGEQTEIKKRILNTLIPDEVCKTAYSSFNSLLVGDHFCTLETEMNVHSCNGDSGAPVIFSVRNQWHQEGITSFGKFCHAEFPDFQFHTKVANYLDWIVKSIGP